MKKNCPDCNTKLRKFKDGFICQNNHKFLSGSKVHDNIINSKIAKIKLNKKLCPLCQTPPISICQCSISELRCINKHVWTHKYYQGDERYLCENYNENDHHNFKFY